MVVEVEENDSADDSDDAIMDTPPQRVTRSKMRPIAVTAACDGSKVPFKKAPLPSAVSSALSPAAGVPLRMTRSKMRVKEKDSVAAKKNSATPTPASDGFRAPATPTTVVRNKRAVGWESKNATDVTTLNVC